MNINILKSTVVRVHDGDTAVLAIEWLDLTKTSRVRFAGINCPELTNPDGSGIKALDYTNSLLPVGLVVYVESHIVDNYGRVLGTIYLTKDATTSVNQMILDNNHAVPMSIERQMSLYTHELSYKD